MHFSTNKIWLGKHWNFCECKRVKYVMRFCEKNRKKNQEMRVPFWLKEEDDKLLSLVLIKGSGWVEISKSLNRTPNSVRNRFKRLFDIQPRKVSYICSMCGELKRGHNCRTLSEPC